MGCSSDSDSDPEAIARKCVIALQERHEGDTSKPSACDALSEEDYLTLSLAMAFDDAGFFDEDGNVDMDAILGK
ncbi:hypothetical protein ACWGNE_00465 [Streptomyces xiamenensis]|uniref:hypothetical protein n=1 Tax=Streptomyces xiamenensis TaxID=408015 RepID=UPI0036C094AF